MISYYNTGTATVGAGGTTVTFAAAGLGSVEFPTIQPGDLFTDPAQPEVPPQRIASLNYAANTAELWEPWPGSAMVAAPYEIRLIGDVVRSTAQTRRYLEMLGQLAALGIQPNAFGEFSDRDAYDDQARGFIFLDIGDPWTLYIKLSSDVGDWDDGQSMEGAPGPAGPPGADSTVPGPAGPANTLSIGTVTDGVSADATITGTAPTQTLNLVLPQSTVPGPPGPPGSGSVDSVNGDPGPDIVLDADDIDDTSTTHKFATAAQLAAVGTALQPAAIGVSVQAYDADLTAWAGVNPSSYSTTAQIAAAYQPLDSDLTAIAGLSTQTFGRSRLTDASAADARVNIAAPTFVSTRTDLKALDTTKDTQVLFDGSLWRWTTGDFTARIAVDTQEGVYIKANAIAASAGAWVRQGWWSTLGVAASWFGVVGDGVADDYAALQAAINFMATYAVDLVLPPGTFKTSAGLTIPLITVASGKKVKMRGVNRTASVIQGAHSGSVLTLGNSANTAFSTYVVLEDFGLSNFAGSTPTGALDLYDIVRSSFVRMRFSGCSRGIRAFGGVALSFDDCDIDGNAIGVVTTNFASLAGGGYPNYLIFRSCRFVNNSSRGISFSKGRMLVLVQCDIEGNGTSGVSTDAGVYISTDVGTEGSLAYAPGLIARDCWFEANAGAGSVVLLSGTNKVEDCYFIANPNATYDIYIGSTAAYHISGTKHDTVKTTYITDEGTASRGNSITNARRPDGAPADIVFTANGGRTSVDGVVPPVTKTANFTVAVGEDVLINNKSGSSCTVTLPAASAFLGREIEFNNEQAQTLVSNASNVIPKAGGAAGTAILPATAGAWAVLTSNGTHWKIMRSGT